MGSKHTGCPKKMYKLYTRLIFRTIMCIHLFETPVFMIIDVSAVILIFRRIDLRAGLL
jgi:hypothetical protein